MLLSSSPYHSLFLSKSNNTTSYSFSSPTKTLSITIIISKLSKPINLSSISQRASMGTNVCRAKRRVRYEDAEGGEEEEYGHNKEIALLEMYSQSATKEALLVQALVDEQEVEVLIFRGFSSCLTYGTSPDPSRSVIPARAVIKCIDRIKGPFDPSNVEYLEKDLSWDAFKNRVV